MYLIFSTSLTQSSRSRALARRGADAFERRGLPCELIDLATHALPDCDGDACYRHPAVQSMARSIEGADAILIASPIYNFDVSASAKRLVELTGSAWEKKIVGFLASAGGPSSFMSLMSFANSLMLDFRAFIVPRFVYATDDLFQDFQISDPSVLARIDELVVETDRIAKALLGAREF